MLSKLFAGTLFISVFVCICAGLAAAQGIGDRNRPLGLSNRRITGKVVLPDGTPGKDITVNLVGTETPTSTVRTNADGSFEFSGLGSGNYTVSVRAAGFR